MIVRDHLGLALSGADATSAAHYDAAIAERLVYRLPTASSAI